MLTISRENAFQIYQDYLDYRFPVVEIDGLKLKASEVVVRSQSFKAQDAMLDKFLYQEEVGGRVIVSQDGLSISITAAGRAVYEKMSPYFIREYTNV
jgi:hypothetical protein